MRIGPMFSGKTTWLNGELTELADNGFKVLKVSHSEDVRSDVATCDDSGSTHNSSFTKLTSKIDRIKRPVLADIDVDPYHVIGVDECQFFPDLVEVISNWIEEKGKHVRVVGLDGDIFKQKFGQTIELIPMADEVVKLNARCAICVSELKSINFRGNIMFINGSFTKRLGSSKEQKIIGGSEQYIPVCRYHHSNN